MRLKNKLLVSSLGIIGLPAIMSASMILSSTDNIKLNASKTPLQTKQLKDKQSTTNTPLKYYSGKIPITSLINAGMTAN